jgi:hypothetical protein
MIKIKKDDLSRLLAHIILLYTLIIPASCPHINEDVLEQGSY